MSVELSSYAVARAKKALIRTLKKVKGVRLKEILSQGRLALSTFETNVGGVEHFYNVGVRLFYKVPPDPSDKDNYSELTLVSEPIVEGDVKLARRKALRTFIFILRDRDTKATLSEWVKKRLSVLNQYVISRENGRAMLELPELDSRHYGSPSWIEGNPKSLDYLASKAIERPDTRFKRKKWSAIVVKRVFHLQHDGDTVATVDMDTGETRILDKAWANTPKKEKIASLLDTLRVSFKIPVTDERQFVLTCTKINAISEFPKTPKPTPIIKAKVTKAKKVGKHTFGGRQHEEVDFTIPASMGKKGEFTPYRQLPKGRKHIGKGPQPVREEQKEIEELFKETKKGEKTTEEMFGADYIPEEVKSTPQSKEAQIAGLISVLKKAEITELDPEQHEYITKAFNEMVANRVAKAIKEK